MHVKERHTSYALALACTISLGGFLFGYNTSVISGALLFLTQQFSLTTFQEGLAVSIILIGALLGALCAGSLADRFGRRMITLLTALIFIIGIWAVVIASSFDMFLWGRFITGLGVGLASLTVPLYLAEIAPSHCRGAFVAMNQLAITIGIFAAYTIDYLFTPEAAWRSMFAVALIPAAIQFLGMLIFPESPSWLLAHGHREKAVLVFKRLRLDKGWEKDIGEIKTIPASREQIGWKGLLKPPIRAAVVIGLLLSIFQQITGINTVIYYAPKIFQNVGYPSASSTLFATMGIGAINVLFTLISVWLIDRIGRRPLLLIGVGGMVISLLTLSYVFFTQSAAIELFAVVSLMSYVAFFAIGLGPIAFVILSEIYPLQVRGRAMSLSIFANWLFNYLVSLTFLDLVQRLGSAGTFCLYAVIGILAFWFVYRFIPETKGKRLSPN